MAGKILIVHGVGSHADADWLEITYDFRRQLTQATGARVMMFTWNHPGHAPLDTRPDGIAFGKMRDWVHDVIMDAAYSAQVYTKEMRVDLPEADMYIGHSAGGILVHDKPAPCVTMGTPLGLLQRVGVCSIASDTPKQHLNILHPKDTLAVSSDTAKNVVLGERIKFGEHNPVGAHGAYWTSDEAVKLAIEWWNSHVAKE